MLLPLSHKDNRSLSYRIRNKLHDWKRLIFSDKNSRNLFLFLLLNLSFAFVELFYGIVTNSLGEHIRFTIINHLFFVHLKLQIFVVCFRIDIGLVSYVLRLHGFAGRTCCISYHQMESQRQILMGLCAG